MQFVYAVVFVFLFLDYGKAVKCDYDGAYSIVIEVTGNTHSKSCVQPNTTTNRWQCGTLLQALQMSTKTSLNHGCIEITVNNTMLEGTFTFHQLYNLTITSYASEQAMVNCFDHEAGISFINSSRITISKLTFEECGRLETTTFPNQQPVKLTTVLYFENVIDVVLDSIKFINHRGYGLVFTDSTSEISLTNLILNGNRPWTFYYANETEKHFYGGGLLFQHVSKEILYGTKLKLLKKCKFERLLATNLSSADHEADKHKPAGYGAGMCIILKNSESNFIHLHLPVFHENKAIHGGGLYLEHGRGSRNNNVLVQYALFHSNHALMSGGGFEYFNERYPHLAKNTLNIDDSQFLSNRADKLYGGGFSLRQKAGTDPTPEIFKPTFVKTFVSNSHEINENNAKLGAAFFFEDAFVRLENCEIFQNNPLFSDLNGFAAVYSYKTHLVVNDISFQENNETAIVLDYSTMHVKGEVTFMKNRGVNGGGMALFAESHIDMTDPNAVMKFIKNRANRGGGLYAQLSGPFIGIWKSHPSQIYVCYFNVGAKKITKVYFLNNTANEGEGNDIFSTTLETCINAQYNKLKEVFRSWPQFHFAANNSITTEPQHIYILNKPWKPYPGIQYKAPIQLIDETGRSVSGVVKMDIKPHDPSKTVIERHGYQEFVVRNNAIEFILEVSDKDVWFNLTFSTSSGAAQPKSTKVHIDHCPFAYQFFDSNMKYSHPEKKMKYCDCDTLRNRRRGIVECRSPDEIYVYANLWYKPEKNLKDIKDDNEKMVQCPHMYCRNCDHTENGENKVVCKFNKTNQCVPDRDETSTLCSKCKGDKSVNWGSERCYDSKEETWKIVLTCIAFSVLIFLGTGLIILFNIDIYSLYLNSFFYFYQVIELFFTTTFEPKIQLAKTLIGMINLKGFGKDDNILSFPHFNDMYKSVPNLVLIVVAIFSLFLHLYTSWIEKLMECCCNIQVMKENNYRAVVFLILFCYGSLARIAFTSIQWIRINEINRVFEDADNIYLQGNHKLIFAINFIVLLFVLLLPFGLYWNDANFMRNKMEWLYKKMKHVCDMLKAPFRDDGYSQFFSIYYLIWRFVLNLVSMVLISQNPSRQLVLTVLTCISVVILVLFAIKMPYKTHLEHERVFFNYWDIFILLWICLIGVISNSKQKISSYDPTNNLLDDIIQGLILVPFFCVCGINLIRFVIFIVWLCRNARAESCKEFTHTLFNGGYQRIVGTDQPGDWSSRSEKL